LLLSKRKPHTEPNGAQPTPSRHTNPQPPRLSAFGHEPARSVGASAYIAAIVPETSLRTGITEPATPALRLVPETASGAATPPAVGTPPPTPVPRLEIPPYDLGAALRLEAELGVSHTVAQILARRGLAEPAEARVFLAAAQTHDPSEFDGIAAAVSSIQGHIEAGSPIVVHGDYDVDGVCATAILVRALRSLGADARWFIPSRTDDGYGLSAATVLRLAARGTRLLITVDCGITAVDEVARATAAGLDVVVTDHHSPRADGALPDCPIVHPAVCGYPCPELCGTAVAFKLAEALGAPTAREDIELVALATVADLVPLRGENRRLVREGLSALANTAKPGLRALMAVARVDPSGIDAHALGFRLGPRINAAGRIRRADAGLELLLTDDPLRAAQIAAELDALNVERRAVEQRIGWEADELVAAMGGRSAYVLAAEGWHQGVIGIVASRVVERYHRPAILIALDGDELAHGSGRSIPGFDLLGALHAAAGSIERYGGHRAAAGLTIARGRIDDLRAAVERHAEAVLTPEMLAPVQRIDAIVAGTELGLGLAEELARLEPCGLGNPGPQLLVPGARFTDVRPMGEGKHARFSVISAGTKARAVAFGCDGRPAPDIDLPLDAAFKLERNVWQGAVEPRLVLRHSRPCEPRPIEIIGEPDDYLAAAFRELDAPLEGDPALSWDSGDATAERTILDRRGEGALAVIEDARAAGGPVLAVCADVPRRVAGLTARTGGFALASYHALTCQPELAEAAASLVALDPPADGRGAALLRAGPGFTHLAWGTAELRFAEQINELEYGFRASLVAIYRAVRHRGTVAGEELELLLRGEGPHGRPARVAGRLIRILVELELVSLDRDLPGLTLASESRTALERSPSFRVYAQRQEDGRRFLSSANLRASA
jgi:single-stranded-DNA-specific exonuclease